MRHCQQMSMRKSRRWRNALVSSILGSCIFALARDVWLFSTTPLLRRVAVRTCRTCARVQRQPVPSLSKEELDKHLGSDKVQGVNVWTMSAEGVTIRGGLDTLRKRGFLYLLRMRYTEDPESSPESPTPYFKIGHARNFQKRLQTLRTAQPFQLEVQCAVQVPDCKNAEQLILNEFPQTPALQKANGGTEWRWLSEEEREQVELRMMTHQLTSWQKLDDEQWIPMSTMCKYIGSLHSPSSSDAQQDRHLNWNVLAERCKREGFADVASALPSQPEVYDSVPDNDVQSVAADPINAKIQVQQEVVDSLMDYYFNQKNGTRATAVLPGGAGKTVLGLRIAEAFFQRGDVNSVLVLLPTLDLVSQTVREWKTFNSWEPNAWSSLAICSKVSEKDLEYTTDVDRIAQFLWGDQDKDKLKVIFSTYQSNNRITEAAERSGVARPFDLCICDEAHETAGLGSKKYARPLLDEFIQAKYRLFLTATPRIFGRTEEGAGLRTVASMNDTSLYGPIVYRLPYREAVARGIVVPLKLMLINTTDSYQRLLAETPDLGVAIKGVNTSMAARRDLVELALALLDAMQNRNVSSIFSFHSTNAEAEEFQQVADEIFRICLDGREQVSVERVHGKMPPAQRRGILNTIGHGRPVLVANARVLTTGVSVPQVDMVVLTSKTRSQVSTLQAMARAARIFPGKAVGYVFVPYSESFDAVVEVMSIFVQNDLQLAEEIQTAALMIAEKGRDLRANEWPVGLQAAVEKSNLPLTILEKVISTAVRELTPTWDYNFKLLNSSFRVREGHVAVPTKHSEDGVPLGQWLKLQRAAGRRGVLDERRRSLLEDLGVDFQGHLTFAEALRHLRTFHEREGHADVAANHKEGGRSLGTWVNTQRTKNKNGKLDSDERVALEAIGVDLKPLEAQWDSYCEALQTFISRTGTIDVPRRQAEAGRDVGAWLDRQRSRAARSPRSGGLIKKRRLKLEALGLDLDPHAAAWCRWMVLLEKFAEREGHSKVPSSHQEDGEKLGAWLGRQRSSVRKGEMSEDRLKLLESVGVPLDAVVSR